MPSLREDLGMKTGEGLVCAYIPATADILQDWPTEDGHLYTHGDIALDFVRLDNKPVKWWVLKNVARSFRYNHPEPIWHGPVEDFGVQCLPDVPQPEGTKLAVRQYHSGPWITLSPEDLAAYAN